MPTGSTNFPTSLDGFPTTRANTDPVGPDAVNHAAALNALEAEVGTTSPGLTTVRGRLASMESGQIIAAAATGVAATDTANINAALAACVAAGGGIVRLRPGAYVTNSQISIPRLSNGALVLRGAGAGSQSSGVAATSVTYTGTGATTYAFKIGDGTANDARWTFIEDMIILGNASCLGGILFESTRFCGVRRCGIFNFTKSDGRGIYMSADATTQWANYFNVIEENQFRNSIYGIILEGENTAGTGANSNYVQHNHFGIHTTALWIRGADTNRVHDNEFNGAITTAVRLEGPNAVRNMVMFNQFDGPTTHVNIVDSGVIQTYVLWNSPNTLQMTDVGTDTSRWDGGTYVVSVLGGLAGQSVDGSIVYRKNGASEENNVKFASRKATDTVDQFRIRGKGDVEWGSGGAVTDILLQRGAANRLDLMTADLRIGTAGRGLRVAEGANAKMGTATLVAGTVVVSTTAVTANSRIMLTGQNSSGTHGDLTVSARTAATSFTITSTSGTDTRSVAWMLIEPA